MCARLKHEIIPTACHAVSTSSLTNVADLLAYSTGLTQQIVAGDAYRALVGRKQRRQDTQRRRLPGPVGSQKPENFTFFDRERESAYRFDRPAAHAKAFPQILDFNGLHTLLPFST